jgi:GT2 family glycosyltransferase
VCAVLVVSDGAAELPTVFATLSAQRYAALDIVVVDNATRDSTREVIARRVAPERLVRLKRRVGFGRAVGAGLRHPAAERVDLVLLLHDDLALAPNATAVLVAAFQADPNLSIVGPKLREWTEQPTLQEVGMTVDLLGRAESLLEPGELDQGQQDTQREVLYVSTAGMMLRRDVLTDLRGFDPRFPALRDDLDLCWRAWLQGHRVEVVPAAVGYHLAAASRRTRPLGRGRSWEPRELAERHTVATLLKCYGLARLIWILPLVLLVGLGKLVAFLVTRRFSDALAVARAYAWNLGQLPRTLRRRREVQRHRELGDSELARLFAPGLPRIRTYGEAAVGWIAGGGTRALLEDAELQDPEAPTRRPDDSSAGRIQTSRARP